MPCSVIEVEVVPEEQIVAEATGRSTVDDLVVALARRGVAKTAPGELPLFTATATAYLVDPDEALKPRKQRDEVLGFGVGEVVTLMAPVALAVAREMVHFLIGHVRDVAKEETSPVVRRILLRLVRRDESPVPAEEEGLSPAQLARMREIAIDTAMRLDLPTPKAHLLADAMVGTFVRTG
jgi:hypothetical protein